MRARSSPRAAPPTDVATPAVPHQMDRSGGSLPNVTQGEIREPVPHIGFGEKIIWWLGANFGLASTPLLANAFTGQGLGWNSAISRGELTLVACAICGLAVVTAVTAEANRKRLRQARAAIVTSGLISLFAAGLVYAGNYQRVELGETPNVITHSYILLGTALLLGFGSLALESKVRGVSE